MASSRHPTSEIRHGESACPNADQLDAFVKGRLSDAETEAVAAHLDACDDCWRRVQSNPFEAAMDDDLRWASRLQAETQVDINVPLARLSEHLPDYDIVGEIGRGGMGIVYKAYHPRLDRMVALKVLPALLGAVRPDAISRFRREAALAARLKHNNIIAVYDCGEIDGTLYYTMELVEGPSLRDVLQEIKETGAIVVVVGEPTTETSKSRNVKTSKEGEAVSSQPTAISQKHGDPSVPSSQSAIRHPKPKMAMTQVGSSTVADRSYYRRVATWMAEVAEALDYAHGRGVIHRDVKPSNLLLSADGRIMISDFGLARGSGVETLTATRSLMGTCRYMSPEQVDESRGPIDPQTDVYALGATMYELLAFRPMFAGADDREVLGCVLNKEPTPPRKSVRQVPRDLGTICLKAVEKDRDARYATAQAMADDLRRWLLDLPIHARRPSLPARAQKFVRRRKAPVALGTTAVVLLIAAGVLYSGYHSSRRQEAQTRAIAESRGVQLTYLEAQSELHDGSAQSALRKIDNALSDHPDRVELHLLRAKLLRYLRRQDEAVQHLEDLVARDPQCWAAHYELSLAYKDAGDQDRFTRYREQVERLTPDTPQARILQIYAEEDPKRAIQLLDDLLEDDPGRLEAVVERAHRYLQLQDYDAMLMDAERAVGLRPEWSITHALKGRAMLRLGRYADAVQGLSRAIELSPQMAGFRVNRCLANCGLTRFSEAIADASAAFNSAAGR